MNPEELEARLARYELAAPPPGHKQALMASVLLRERSRRRTLWSVGIGVAALVVSVLLSLHADRVYDEAVRVVDGGSRPPGAEALTTASVLSLDVPGAYALLRSNGDHDE